MRNEIFLSLCIWGFEDIDHSSLTDLIGIHPSKIHIKGEQINPNFPKIASKNGWFLDSELGKYASFEEQLLFFTILIESKKETFEWISKKYYCELSCALYLYCDNGESTPGIHLNSRYTELTKNINLEFDLDIYCLKNED